MSSNLWLLQVVLSQKYTSSDIYSQQASQSLFAIYPIFARYSSILFPKVSRGATYSLCLLFECGLRG